MTKRKLGNFNLLFPKQDYRLHSMLVNCGHSIVSSRSYRWDGMKRGSRELVIWQYTLAGQGAFDFCGRTIPLVPGTAFLAVVPEEHCYYLPEYSSNWEFVYASFSGAEAVRVAGECRSRYGTVSEYDPGSSVVQKAWNLFDRCCENDISNAFDASRTAYDFLMGLLENSGNSSSGRDDSLIRMVHDYCLQNISSGISVENIAGFLGLSRWYLSRRFQQAYGKPLHAFITELKMRMAVRRLQSSRDSVKEIASFCGFDDPSYFCKVFKSFYGAAPAEFRYGRQKKSYSEKV